MNWNQQFDEYCERLGPGLWAEPLNFLSNGFFILSAAIILILALKKNMPLQLKQSWLIGIILTSLVGIGSGLYHSFSTLWAQIADVGAIALYVFWAIPTWLIKVHRKPRSWLIYCVLITVIGSYLGSLIASYYSLNGSEGYLGIALCLLFLGYQDRLKNGSKSRIFEASLTFIISLCFRSIDQYACSWVPIGTHFAWHATNAGVLYLVNLSMLEFEESKLSS